MIFVGKHRNRTKHWNISFPWKLGTGPRAGFPFPFPAGHLVPLRGRAGRAHGGRRAQGDRGGAGPAAAGHRGGARGAARLPDPKGTALLTPLPTPQPEPCRSSASPTAARSPSAILTSRLRWTSAALHGVLAALYCVAARSSDFMQPETSMAPPASPQGRERQSPFVFPAAAAILTAAPTERERPPPPRGRAGGAAAAILVLGVVALRGKGKAGRAAPRASASAGMSLPVRVRC